MKAFMVEHIPAQIVFAGVVPKGWEKTGKFLSFNVIKDEYKFEEGLRKLTLGGMRKRSMDNIPWYTKSEYQILEMNLVVTKENDIVCEGYKRISVENILKGDFDVPVEEIINNLIY